ncbi:DNA mismatch repair endonuclease MutL [Nicoliella spurrieriana]|uniref:DNA mismatch repair protein MutL n=1 Tax=Nicoliella spurrieriana TaxID=2925830 RepID=A0A976X6R0_9LACO|nr:DNA mismatch repair endonuclease MutL [Nicoliella spurrieriana]UQS87526.1 DNA mismatch repair endonuclease MutL [Nicoliella spurrieriana]
MGAIHKLSPILSNQIAAGEVVERPASVVKELVENSIDAHSTQIDVNISDAGFKMIQVIDDGRGIDPKDLPLAFTRHATSKIIDRRDLFNVHSLGFRGEALPSIASVADVDLKTSNGTEGAEYHVRGGKLIDRKPAELRRGTSVSVSNLFFNTPARLKYMKTPATELSKITDAMNQIALGHPEISFTLVHNQRELLRTAGRNDQLQVIGGIYGASKAHKMLSFKGADLDFKINGYVSLPELTRANRNYVVVILNGRFVKNYSIVKAIVDGYKSKLMVGRYPIAVINIQTDPTLVDVNVHPTKQSVRISKEEQLCTLITNTIAERFLHQNLIPDVMNQQRPVQPKYHDDQLAFQLNQNSTHYQAAAAPLPQQQPPVDSNEPTNKSSLKPQTKRPKRVIMVENKADLASADVQKFVAYYQAEGTMPPFDSATNPKPAATLAPVEAKPAAKPAENQHQFPNLVYIGQMHGTYLLTEAADGMYIVDQHAAQERINYERFRESIGDVANDQQDLLVPIVLEYSTTDTLVLSERLELLKSIGIFLEPFGKNSFIVRSHPTWFINGRAEQTIREMVDQVLTNGKLSVAQFRAQTAITMSCKRAIKANHHLDRQQAVSLLDQLSQVEDPYNCPHGRPVLVHFTNYDMQKMFKRIQDSHESQTKRN